MTFHDFMKKINDFLLAHSGFTNTLFEHARLSKPEPIKNLFFKPYQSKSEFFFKTSSVITAPIFISIISLELAVGSLCLGFRSIIDLARLDPPKAKIHAIDAAVFLVCSFVALITSIASPFINLIDLVGSGINSLRQNKEEPMEPAPSLN